MSEELRQNETLETTGSEQERLVPVTEAIKYRKRAQTAEQELSSLEKSLQESNEKLLQSQRKLECLQFEQTLNEQLNQAGATDYHVVKLLAKEKLHSSNSEQPDVSEIIEQVRQERPQLFADQTMNNDDLLAKPTAGIPPQAASRASTLIQLANKAGRSRKDMQEYLKLRRQMFK